MTPMARTPFTLTAVSAVVLGLAVPTIAAGQAIPRTSAGTSSAGTASSGSSGSSGGVSGGSSSSSSGGSSGGGVSRPPESRGTNGGDSGSGTFTGSTGTRGHRAAERPAPGGVTAPAPARSATATPVNAAAERRTGTGGGDATTGISSSLTGRQRGDNPVTGFAAARQLPTGGGGDGDFVSFPFWGPWGSWYPWYSYGFGWGFGYYGYNPWYYGATCWGWGRWGAWYDPYGYCWNPYWGAPTTYVEIAGGSHKPAKAEPTTGKLRILASPKTASVYIDDALAGTVDEFDGLNEHFELDKGRHVVSIKADGYLPAVQEVVVEGGKTKTVRFSMKKAK